VTTGVAISGTGTHFPADVLTNAEVCGAFNEWVRRENARLAADIAAGTAQPLLESTPEFVVKASGILERRVVDKAGVLDVDRMCPNIPQRGDDELSLQAEFSVKAAEIALERAGRCGEDLDMILLAAGKIERAYPAVAMEVQAALGARGFAYDMSVGCSSSTFPIQTACDAIRAGNATCALVVNPEIMTGNCNFRDRDSHFIFGDAGTAIVLEPIDRARPGSFEIISTKLMSKYSNNIRNNFGFLNRCDPPREADNDKLFTQQGRKVYKDVVPLASSFILAHLESVGIDPKRVSRYWLHQANANMNQAIARRILDREATQEEAPIVLDRYGNVASAGSIIAFDHYQDDLPAGAYGVLCSFGAGYSIGSCIVRRM
jgi:beta-ketodecanoyl-[acyl-carrier-protein] synthase